MTEEPARFGNSFTIEGNRMVFFRDQVVGNKQGIAQPPKEQNIAEPPTASSPGLLARTIAAPIIFTARLIALVIAFSLWVFPILPIWFALLMRTMAAFGWATVKNLFTGRDPPDQARLDYIAALWVHGAIQIFRTPGRITNAIPRPPQFDPVQEFFIACGFWLWMITTLALLPYWLSTVLWVLGWFWYIIALIASAILYVLRQIPYFPF